MMWELAKPQTYSLGNGLFITSDFSDGLTKEEYIARERIKDGVDPIVEKDGRILMPKLGII